MKITTTEATPLNQSLDQQGFAIVPRVLAPGEHEELVEVLGLLSNAGRRGLLGIPEIAQLATSARLIGLVRPHLGAEPRPVRSILFDKPPEANWIVPWPQDLTLAVRDRVEVGGFGPWSVKDGIPHVQPPMELLEQMLTVRLHLDDCDAENGALRVVLGSHRYGRLSPAPITELRDSGTEIMCELSAGDAHLMRPLVLHSSGRSRENRHRRVLHIEYAGFPLPESLQWHDGA